ncbi:glycosyltransferase family 4 protein [Hyalangium rubrum]|uniref:Glycosyltransferase n=1 Tax=Hyalangium rubrum TaxID=3103134 RepID=A0ABU5GUN4_9BACT|nr:glycosyltransferase [Hyalangium sp. s54d21]MDY7224801.1 glycosyltransferase [Hyalangium sp. s54d21]
MERLSCSRLSDLPRLLLCSFDVIPGPSGSSRRLTEYLKALPDRFHVVVLSAKTPDHSHIEKYQGARLLRVPVGSGDLASRIQAFERAVRRQLESEEYALAHFTDPFGGYALCELKGDYGYRLIYEAQTFPSQELRYTHPQTEGDKRFLAKIRRQELFCLMNADRVVTGSQATQSYIQSLGASTEQIRLLRAPVDLTPYTPDVLGAPDSRPMRLMYLGSQSGWQGLPTLFRALAIALEKGAEAKLTLVGARHPDWQPHLEDLSKELGIQAHVEFQPPVLHDDLVKVLALADVGVIPLDDVDRNRLQGGPLAKVSEYLAAGRPVIAADLPVTRELIPESTVLFHPPGDARALAERIIELARDVPRRVAMGQEARAFAEQELDAGIVRGKLLDLYDELLGPQAPVSAPTELPMPTMTGTPTNRIPQLTSSENRKNSALAASEPAKPAASAPVPPHKEPSREDLPLVVGQVLDENVDTRLIKTEPDVRPNEPPVVMGLPLREKAAPSVSSLSVEEPPAPTPIVRPPASLREEPPAPTPIVKPPAGLREEPPEEEPPTPVLSPPPVPRREATPPTPTPVVRLPPEPVREEPPAPTPIVQMKTLGPSRSSRPEPPPSRPPVLTPIKPPPEPVKAPPELIKSPPEPVKAPPEPVRAQQEPAEKSRSLPPALPKTPPTGTRTPPPLTTPASPPPPRPAPPPVVAVVEEEPEELPEDVAEDVSDEPEDISDEAQDISDEAELDAAPTPPHPHPRLEEPEEISSDEVQETGDADAVEAVDDHVEPVEDAVPEAEADPIKAAEAAVPEAEAEPEDTPEPAPPNSALDPWFAQLAHGYCPPEGAQFARHTPPTTFPGRDEDTTDPSRVPPPPSLAQGAPRGKSS